MNTPATEKVGDDTLYCLPGEPYLMFEATDGCIATVHEDDGHVDPKYAVQYDQDAHANRLADCWNACKDLTPSAIPALVEAVEHVLQADELSSYTYKRLRDALLQVHKPQ